MEENENEVTQTDRNAVVVAGLIVCLVEAGAVRVDRGEWLSGTLAGAHDEYVWGCPFVGTDARLGRSPSGSEEAGGIL